MKLSISYRPDDAAEERQVRIIRRFLEHFLPSAKVRISHNYAPYLHVYLSTKKAEKSCNTKENA